jgi:hypothetical protein
MRNIKAILQNNIQNERNYEFHMLFHNMTSNDVDEEIALIIIEIYKNAKETNTKNTCLKLLFDKEYVFLKDFFTLAYSKSRYLDMKLNALRGLAHFESEKKIESLLIKFDDSLRKRPQSTPYNYQEYELLRGKHALPYLIKKYGYRCFKETLEIVEKQYNEMPDAFKGHYTTDELGNIIQLRNPEETSKMMQDFFDKQRTRT